MSSINSDMTGAVLNEALPYIRRHAGKTVVVKYGGNADAAAAIGKAIAEKATAAGVKTVCFDRGPYKYHGRVAAFADGAREGGLSF